VNNEEKQRNYDLARKLLAEQNFAAAVIGGAVATVLAAAAFGIAVAILRASYAFAAAGSPIDGFRTYSLPVLAERAMSRGSLVELFTWFVAGFATVFLARRSLSRSERLADGLFELRDWIATGQVPGN
jgi:TctA family transporter